MKRLSMILLGTALTVFSLLVPAAPANAESGDIRITIDRDLTVRAHIQIGFPLDVETPWATLTCGMVASGKVLPDILTSLSDFKIESCDSSTSSLSLEVTGQLKEDYQSASGWLVTENEIILNISPSIAQTLYAAGLGRDNNNDSDTGLDYDSDSDTESDPDMDTATNEGTESVGGLRVTFPGNIQTVESAESAESEDSEGSTIGESSGDTWSVNSVNEIDRTVTITAQRNPHKPRSFFALLGTIIVIGLIATAVIVAVAAVVGKLKNRPRKSRQSAANNYYPYPYPYPPNNLQNPTGGYYPPKKQGYGFPTPGFPVSEAFPQPQPAIEPDSKVKATQTSGLDSSPSAPSSQEPMTGMSSDNGQGLEKNSSQQEGQEERPGN
ncbi:MAG: hypothetical protein ACLVCI_03245 [Varibaculum timonense]